MKDKIRYHLSWWIWPDKLEEPFETPYQMYTLEAHFSASCGPTSSSWDLCDTLVLMQLIWPTIISAKKKIINFLNYPKSPITNQMNFVVWEKKPYSGISIVKLPEEGWADCKFTNRWYFDIKFRQLDHAKTKWKRMRLKKETCIIF